MSVRCEVFVVRMLMLLDRGWFDLNVESLLVSECVLIRVFMWCKEWKVGVEFIFLWISMFLECWDLFVLDLFNRLDVVVVVFWVFRGYEEGRNFIYLFFVCWCFYMMMRKDKLLFIFV